LDQFEMSPDEMLLPVGLYVAPAQAWLAVQDFVRDATALPAAVTWIDAGRIEWQVP
jgi:hypothetical protein